MNQDLGKVVSAVMIDENDQYYLVIDAFHLERYNLDTS